MYSSIGAYITGSKTMDWKLSDNPAPLINMASRAFMRLGDRRMKPLGLGIGQIPVLYLLRDGSAISQKELAQHAKIEQPSMAQMLARMERDGLVRRTPDPDDGRSTLFSLTKLALSKLPAARAALLAGSKTAWDGFSAEEIATLLGLLRRLNENLERAIAEEAA
jgi:MarR family transcriptional regulator for hemolysin